ncbi:PTS sugar transporter subunit IIB [Paenibacillus macerans]|uniref:PTS sugar transporter subunit IIB n=1 Tax=Paenibacillus macerans TaxID=44252 RepID=UPI00203E4676|nr:PTS sugar transporter subunit IIB [Paenibacillus macerans]MCM3699532.1 PTS sugar transporter subunit IIB [Paenibacillus macerans]
MNILLVCAGGISTSILEKSIRDAFGPERADWKVEAHPVDQLEALIDDFDVVLLGPQIRHKLRSVEKTCTAKGKPCEVIDSRDYALSKGDKVLKRAMELVQA